MTEWTRNFIYHYQVHGNTILDQVGRTLRVDQWGRKAEVVQTELRYQGKWANHLGIKVLLGRAIRVIRRVGHRVYMEDPKDHKEIQGFRTLVLRRTTLNLTEDPSHVKFIIHLLKFLP